MQGQTGLTESGTWKDARQAISLTAAQTKHKAQEHPAVL